METNQLAQLVEATERGVTLLGECYVALRVIVIGVWLLIGLAVCLCYLKGRK